MVVPWWALVLRGERGGSNPLTINRPYRVHVCRLNATCEQTSVVRSRWLRQRGLRLSFGLGAGNYANIMAIGAARERKWIYRSKLRR